VVGLGGAAALSLALLNPIPLLIGLVAEAAYLLFVPDSSWYMQRLSRRADAEIVARREELKKQIFPQIPENLQQRFARLENIRAQVGGNTDMQDQKWFREVVRKLDYLLEKFLMFAQKEAQFRRYLLTVLRDVVPNYRMKNPPHDDDSTVSIPVRVVDRRRGRKDLARAENERLPDYSVPEGDYWIPEAVQAIEERYAKEISELAVKREAEEDHNTLAILDKRTEVLEQRREYIGKIGKILVNLGHQMELLEDSFGLINDQIRARPPEQVLADIEGVVYQTDSMTRLLEELSSFDQA
jgi:hypothetical protein